MMKRFLIVFLLVTHGAGYAQNTWKTNALDLMDGLEGYPAAGLRQTFENSTKKVCVVRSQFDEPGSDKIEGTLRFCVESAKQAEEGQLTWIVFDPEVFPADGDEKIELQEILRLGSNTVVDGRGARVTIYSRKDIHLFKLTDSKNIVFRNLILHKVAPYAREKFVKKLNYPVSPRPGISANRMREGVNRDVISVSGQSGNLWIDHCEFSLCGDECIDVTSIKGPDKAKVTISWNRFSDQYYTALIGQTAEKNKEDENIWLTFHHNWIEGTARRSPRVNRATADVYNNCIVGWNDWAMAANSGAKVLVENNILEADPEKSDVGIVIGTGRRQPKGFVRIAGNTLKNGAKLDSHMPDSVQITDYKRSVSSADDSLKAMVDRDSGWQKTSVDFCRMSNKK